jgi:hypothetical protein
MTSPTEGREPLADRRPEPIQSLPAPIVPVGGQEPVVAAVHHEQPARVDDTGTSSEDGPTEHRVGPDTRLPLKGRGDGSRSKRKVVFATATVVVAVAVAVAFVLFFTLSGPSGPSPRFQALMMNDPAAGQFLLVGGVANGSDINTLSDMWTWSGRAWTELPQQTPPDNTTFVAAMVYDNATRELVLVEQGPPGHTWVWDGHTWHSAGTLSPTSTLIPALAYDMGTKQLIAVIAADGGAVTSLWNGHHWIEVHDAGSLPPVGGDMAYDQQTDQLLLISWKPGSPTTTWAWTGQRWQTLSSPQEPSRLSRSPWIFG